MKLEYIMTIGVATVIKKGQVIIGGAGKCTDDKVQDFYIVNEEIIIKNAHDEFRFKVKDVDFSTSISGALNVGYVLYESEDFSKIQASDMVYKIIE